MADQELTLSVKEVQVDERLYPRHKLDQYNVTTLMDAVAAGRNLPPIVVAVQVGDDAVGNVLVDGRHRLTCYERTYGETAEIKAIGRTYATVAELYEDAIRLNADHGKRVGHHDTSLIVVRARELGIPLERVADLLAVPTEKLRRRPILAKPVANANGMGATLDVLLKRDLAHLEGMTLTAAQVSANERSAGAVRFHAQQLAMRIEADTVNFNDPRTVKALLRIREILNDMPLPEPGAEAA